MEVHAMDEIPQWGRAGRRYRRETARQLAKEIMQNHSQPKKGKREWDAGWFLAAFMALALLLLAPKVGRGVTVFVLVAMAACLIHPIWKLQLVQKQTAAVPAKKWLRFGTAILLAVGTLVIFGIYVWPPIKRHPLSATERREFENALRPQKGPDLEVQIGCPVGDEQACVYAGQFVNLFGESEWKVQPLVSRLTLSRALDGVTVYRRGGNKEDMMKRWNSGGWFGINEPHLLAVQNAFRVIHIEIDGGANPDLAENVMMIYIGPERDNEAEPTELTRQTDWATGKTKGPFPRRQ
jgi:hypothetical protein